MTKTLTAKYPFVDLVRDDLKQIENMLMDDLQAYDPTLVAAATHLTRAGGKRLRPIMILLLAKATASEISPEIAHHQRLLALAIETLHTATLIHDDIIDRASTRRGIPTVNHKWDEKTSVLTGDFLMARACYYVSLIQIPRLNLLFSQTVMDMCNGEISQSSKLFNPQITQEEYLYQIEYKTAILMAAGCQGSAMINSTTQNIEEAARDYGRNVGMAFQIVDDILDFSAKSDTLGKPGQADLLQGKITLPTYYALQSSPQREKLQALIIRQFEQSNDLVQALDIITCSGGIDFSWQSAEAYVKQAINALVILPDTHIRQALEAVAQFSLSRKY